MKRNYNLGAWSEPLLGAYPAGSAVPRLIMFWIRGINTHSGGANCGKNILPTFLKGIYHKQKNAHKGLVVQEIKQKLCS